MRRILIAAAVAAATVGTGTAFAQSMYGQIFNHANRVLVVSAPGWSASAILVAGSNMRAFVVDNTTLPISFSANNNLVCVATITPNVDATTNLMSCQANAVASGSIIKCEVTVDNNNTRQCSVTVELSE